MKTIECSDCYEGITACLDRPGWFSPADAARAMDAGLAKSLMLDYWEADGSLGHTEVIGAPISGYEGRRAPYSPVGECGFLKDSKCSIHSSGFKPLECSVSCCKLKQPNLHMKIAKMWASDEGRKAVERWKRETQT